MVVANKQKEKVAFLTVDICKLPKESITLMRSYIASQSDIKAGNIMIHATHTHSGPKSDIDAPHAKEYLLRAASAVIEANKQLKPGSFTIGRVKEPSVAFNRRLRTNDDKIRMSFERLDPGSVKEPLGPADPELIALTIKQNNIPRGALINFGCHATTLTAITGSTRPIIRGCWLTCSKGPWEMILFQCFSMDVAAM